MKGVDQFRPLRLTTKNPVIRQTAFYILGVFIGYTIGVCMATGVFVLTEVFS